MSAAGMRAKQILKNSHVKINAAVFFFMAGEEKKKGNMGKQVLSMASSEPIIETERLFLRLFEAGDLDATHKLFNDEDVQKYLSPKNRRTREQLKFSLKKFAEHWQKRGFGVLCVTKKENGEMIGYCGFQYFDETENIEIMFAVNKEEWNKGFATEAARSCLKYGFENLKFDKIYAATDPNNVASRSVIEKLRMRYDEISVHYEMNLAIFSITREVFQALERL